MYGWLVKILFGFYSCIWLIKWIDPIHTSYQTVLKLLTRNITKSRKALITCRSSLFVTNCTTRNHISSLTKSPALSINWRITSTYLHGIFLVWCLYAQSQEDTEKDLHGNHALPWKIRGKLFRKNRSFKWQFLTHCKFCRTKILQTDESH